MRSLILSTILIATTAFHGYGQMGLGIEVGFNASDYKVKLNDVTKPTDMKLGGRVGVIGDIGITDNFYFQPGVIYVTNGFKADVLSGYELYIVNSLEIPLNIQYKIGVLGANRLFVGAGPYVAWNKDGYYRYAVYPADSRRDLRIGSKISDDLKPIDFGFGANAGYQIAAGLFVRLRAQMGLLNLYTGPTANSSVKSTSFSISAGYLFYKRDRSGQVKINRERKEKQPKEKDQTSK